MVRRIIIPRKLIRTKGTVLRASLRQTSQKHAAQVHAVLSHCRGSPASFVQALCEQGPPQQKRGPRAAQSSNLC